VEGWQGRHACVNCGYCNGWGCPNGAKSSTSATVIKAAVATGRCDVRAESCAVKVELGPNGRARSVLYLDRDFNLVEQPARLVILACSTVDTPRLALLSGIPDASGMIGRNLTVHHNPSAVVQITDGVHAWDTYRGAWNTISCDDFQDLSDRRDLPAGIVYPRGGVVSTSGNSPGYPLGTGGPISLAVSLIKPPGFYGGGGNGFAPVGQWGAGFFQAMAGAYGTQAYLLGVCEDLPRAENRVDLDPDVKDVYGLPVARVTYANHPNDVLVGAYVSNGMVPLGEAMLRAIGATGTVGITAPTPTPLTSYELAPRYVVHQHGTMRMGADPKRSVLNRYGQFWAVPNLVVADGSVFPTAGGYNPTLTIQAVAHWIAGNLVRRGQAALESATA